MRTSVDSTWVRAAVLGLVLAVGGVLALTVDLPTVGVARTWVDGAGGVAWAAMVLGLAVLLLAPVPRSALSVLLASSPGSAPGWPSRWPVACWVAWRPSGSPGLWAGPPSPGSPARAWVGWTA